MFFLRYKSIRSKLYFWMYCVFLLIYCNQTFARPWCRSERLNITEATICDNSELRALDAQLAQVYGTAKAHDKDYGQLNWLRNRRNTCYGNIDCIAREYRGRITILQEHVGLNNTPNSRPWCSASRLNITESTICRASHLRDLSRNYGFPSWSLGTSMVPGFSLNLMAVSRRLENFDIRYS